MDVSSTKWYAIWRCIAAVQAPGLRVAQQTFATSLKPAVYLPGGETGDGFVLYQHQQFGRATIIRVNGLPNSGQPRMVVPAPFEAKSLRIKGPDDVNIKLRVKCDCMYDRGPRDKALVFPRESVQACVAFFNITGQRDAVDLRRRCDVVDLHGRGLIELGTAGCETWIVTPSTDAACQCVAALISRCYRDVKLFLHHAKHSDALRASWGSSPLESYPQTATRMRRWFVGSVFGI